MKSESFPFHIQQPFRSVLLVLHEACFRSYLCSRRVPGFSFFLRPIILILCYRYKLHFLCCPAVPVKAIRQKFLFRNLRLIHCLNDLKDLSVINPHFWRSVTGSVMQDSFIFSDTIAGNIAVNTDETDKKRMRNAARMACIDDFIESLPLGYDTIIGMEGKGVSQGQRQRILIARAIYKNPEYIFLDEATNSLDATNEAKIMANMRRFYEGRTVVVSAHRLSTVREADQIIVMDGGRIVERGNHESLLEKRGRYYELVKHQMTAEVKQNA